MNLRSHRSEVKVLVVDDDAVVRERFNSILRDQGCHVITASDGSAAVMAAINTLPDLIFLDVIMPNMDGFQALSEIRRMPKTHKIPVIIVTGRSDAVTLIKALKMGANDFISKPFMKDDVARKMNLFLPGRPKEAPLSPAESAQSASRFVHGKSYQAMRTHFILHFETVYMSLINLVSEKDKVELRRVITGLLDSIAFYKINGVKEQILQMLMAISSEQWDDAIDDLESIYEVFQNLRRTIPGTPVSP